jgi:hypothetical protein
MKDPLKLNDEPDAKAVQLARAASSQDATNIFSRLLSNQYPDSTEVRLQLLAHALYITYRDLKETIANG